VHAKGQRHVGGAYVGAEDNTMNGYTRIHRCGRPVLDQLAPHDWLLGVR
jgi:hypothetical protein